MRPASLRRRTFSQGYSSVRSTSAARAAIAPRASSRARIWSVFCSGLRSTTTRSLFTRTLAKSDRQRAQLTEACGDLVSGNDGDRLDAGPGRDDFTRVQRDPKSRKLVDEPGQGDAGVFENVRALTGVLG